MSKRIFGFITFSLIVLMFSAIGCTSRYRLDLIMQREGERSKIDIEKSEFVNDVAIGNPYSRDKKLIPGDSNCIILHTGTRGERKAAGAGDMLTWDRYVKVDIYILLPLTKPSGSILLKDHAFLDMLGHFELPVDETVYLGGGGELIVDSVTDSHIFGTLDGWFQNSSGKSIGYEGQFKAEHRY